MRLTANSGFSGIDETKKLSEGLAIACDIRNFRVSDSGSLEKRSGLGEICTLTDDIAAMWSGTVGNEELLVFISGGKLYRMMIPIHTSIPSYVDDIPDGEYVMFPFNGMLYIIVNHYYYYKFNGSQLFEVEGYTPLVALSCKPSGEGEIFEQVNLICDKRRQLFSSDGTSSEYILAENDIDEIVSVKVNGNLTVNYALSDSKNSIVFSNIPAEGLNNVEVIYAKQTPLSDRRRIMACQKVMIFGGNSNGRAFLWGNSDLPNYRFHSDLADGVPSVEYFPVNAFTIIGNSRINCIVQQYNRQLIFNENEAYYSYCELRDDGLGNTVSSFPVYSLNGSKGCLIETPGCIIENRPVTLCDDGLNMWESTSVQDEKNAVCFSKPISESMQEIINGDKSELSLFDFQANKELYLLNGSTAYIYNYGNGTWYIYDMLDFTHHTVCGTRLYGSSGGTVYMFGNGIEENSEVECSWASPFITAGHKNGKLDIVKCEYDAYIEGPLKVRFEIIESGSGAVSIKRDFVFSEQDKKFMRLSFRPYFKRAMPLKLMISVAGSGQFSLHGMSIKTREKERSSKHGLQ